jgi:hypothetical protein
MSTDKPVIIDWITAGVAVATLLVTLFGVVMIAGFRIRARATTDTNGVVRTRIVNRGRIAGKVESVDVVARYPRWIRVVRWALRRPNVEAVVARARPQEKGAVKPAAIANWWVRIDFTEECELPDREHRFSKSGTCSRSPDPDEMSVRIAGAFGRPRYRTVARLSGPFAELPSGHDLT